MTRSVEPYFNLLTSPTIRSMCACVLTLAIISTTFLPVVSQTQRKARTPGTSDDPRAWRLQAGKSVRLQAPTTQIKMPVIDQSVWIASARQRRPALTTRRPSASFEVFNAEFQSEEAQRLFSIPGVFVFNRFGKFVDFFVKADPQAESVLKNVSAANGLVWLEWAGTAEAPPPPPIRRGPRARGEAERIVRGGLDGLTGKGVTIAIVDSGLDFRNPDFVVYDAQGRPSSRLLYLWDTTSNAYDSQRLGGKAPISYPNGSSIGTLYSRSDLDKELRSPVKRIPATDLNGHGTACAGVAAGNGNNGKGRAEVKGVAPEANLIAVRIGRSERASMENSFLMGAIAAWLDTVSGKTPLIMSCSFGGQYGGHDGNLIQERQLNARFSADRVGRAVTIAAGNEAVLPIHARLKFRGEDAPGLLKFTGGVGGARVQIYYDTPDLNDLVVVPAGNTQILGNAAAEVNPLSEQVDATIRVGAGVGGIYLLNHSGREMTADAYIYPRAEGDQVRFAPEMTSYQGLVGTPGTTPNAITVASYDWNAQFQKRNGVATFNAFCFRDAVPIDIGNISCYSSPGYARNGQIKPDIAAPGEIYYASYAKTPMGRGVNPGEWADALDFSGNYCLFNGTSAATPYLAGVVALMLQKKGDLKLREIKKLLEENATQNAVTKATPNERWGYGKLDLDAVERILKALE